MTAQEKLNKIKAFFGIDADTTEETKPEEVVVETPAEEVETTEVELEAAPEEVTAEKKIADLEEKLAAAEKTISELSQKFSAFMESDSKRKEGLSEMVKLVAELAELPTAEATEKKNDGIKNFASTKKLSAIERMIEGSKQIKESIKN